MAEDPFLLVSLEESESKELAKVISNKTARKILDFMSKKESATETDIAKQMKVPLSTVHYNLQALLKANLVMAEEFHYSEKGKEVLHYSLANKIIIIAPKKTSRETFMQKLKGILPIGLIALATAGVLKIFSSFGLRTGKMYAAAPSLAAFSNDAAVKTAEVAEESIAAFGAEAARAGGEAAVRAAPTALDMAANASQNLTQPIVEPVVKTVIQTVTVPAEPNIALWFLIGAAFVIILLVIWYWFVTRRRKKR
ncbi:MAG: helix-turn-helix domain-containing protein [Nanoarchaeota archaeon]|nr:helix-turn-helix domain-containing protein [Nanoarchaeota archaeon]MBU1320776.1 helix-turn-helix domain-containing protein [Nanoarchaeota archaeon]MBU1598143.1 helix-turn-helix domain-containing protein [Nanoarchaeota archaeon]MBU2442204.1 helix-turn-helix domain-containing protein [Nanoarchaeota archaeon]